MPKAPPQVTITYCKLCGYAKRATEAATALRDALGVEPKLVPGTGGIFEVAVGREVVTKRTRDEFPSTSDIVQAVRTCLAGWSVRGAAHSGKADAGPEARSRRHERVPFCRLWEAD